MIAITKHKIPLILFSTLILTIGTYLLLTTKNQPNLPPTQNLPAGEISIEGTIVCLPHKNTSGPQTLECAYGLKDNEGKFYGLSDTNPDYSNISKYPGSAKVIVSGKFTPADYEKYQSIGLIEVTDISLVGAPKKMSLAGKYLCLPHKDTSGPQTMECAFGIQTMDGKYYAIDFGLMSQMPPEIEIGDTLSANGLLVPLEQLSSDRWQIYPIEGIFSVTDSIKIL